MSTGFQFKHFYVKHQMSAMKVGTDGILLGVLAPIINVKRALDIGTGTGLVALMLAQRNRCLLVDAVEIENNAAHEALENFKASPFSERLHLFNGCIAKYAQQLLQGEQSSRTLYDLVVINPPFYDSDKHIYSTERAQARAINGFSHLDFIKIAYPLIENEKHIYLILPFLEGEAFLKNLFKLDNTLFEKILQSNGEIPVKLINSGQWQLQSLILIKFTPTQPIKRLVIGLKKISSDFSFEADELGTSRCFHELVQFDLQHLTLRNNAGEYTPEMKRLTKDFLLKH